MKKCFQYKNNPNHPSLQIRARLLAEGIDISRFSKTILQYAFKGQYEWTLTRYISLQSNGSISRKLPDINWFGPDTVLQSAQKIVQASQTIEPAYNIDFSTNLTYRKLTGNTCSFQYSFNQSKGDYGWMPTLEPGYNSSFAAPLDIFRQNSFNLEFRRFIYLFNRHHPFAGKS